MQTISANCGLESGKAEAIKDGENKENENGEETKNGTEIVKEEEKVFRIINIRSRIKESRSSVIAKYPLQYKGLRKPVLILGSY